MPRVPNLFQLPDYRMNRITALLVLFTLFLFAACKADPPAPAVPAAEGAGRSLNLTARPDAPADDAGTTASASAAETTPTLP